MTPYQKKLLDPKWQNKRLEILCRDNHTCQGCQGEMGSSILQVHHKRYILGNEPWEYESKDLITLCSECHSMEEFYKEQIKSTVDSLHVNGVSYHQIFECLSSETSYLLKNKMYGQTGE